jgi:hypothetical protein
MRRLGSCTRVFTFLAMAAIGRPAPLTAQQGQGDLFGAVEISCKDDGSVSVASIDLFKNGKGDGAVDMAFIIVRPSEKFEHANTVGTIHPSPSANQSEYTFLDMLLGQRERIFVAVAPVTPVPNAPRTIGAARIVRFTAGAKQTHKQLADYMFQRTWDTVAPRR